MGALESPATTRRLPRVPMQQQCIPLQGALSPTIERQRTPPRAGKGGRWKRGVTHLYCRSLLPYARDAEREFGSHPTRLQSRCLAPTRSISWQECHGVVCTSFGTLRSSIQGLLCLQLSNALEPHAVSRLDVREEDAALIPSCCRLVPSVSCGCQRPKKKKLPEITKTSSMATGETRDFSALGATSAAPAFKSECQSSSNVCTRDRLPSCAGTYALSLSLPSTHVASFSDNCCNQVVAQRAHRPVHTIAHTLGRGSG